MEDVKAQGDLSIFLLRFSEAGAACADVAGPDTGHELMEMGPTGNLAGPGIPIALGPSARMALPPAGGAAPPGMSTQVFVAQWLREAGANTVSVEGCVRCGRARRSCC